MMDDNFRRILEHAWLTRTELAELYGVSRQTIHYWRVKGPPRESTFTARMATVITQALLAALKRKLLPLPSLAKHVRSARIAAMAKTLQALKPAPLK